MLIDHQGYDSSTKEKKHRIGILTGNIKKEQLYETSTFFFKQVRKLRRIHTATPLFGTKFLHCSITNNRK